MSKHKIYAFNNGKISRYDIQALAIAEDGKILASHICSNETWIPHDLGISSDWKHDEYNAHFGEGNWELEFVPGSSIATHEGLQRALKICNTMPEVAP